MSYEQLHVYEEFGTFFGGLFSVADVRTGMDNKRKMISRPGSTTAFGRQDHVAGGQYLMDTATPEPVEHRDPSSYLPPQEAAERFTVCIIFISFRVAA